MKKIIALLFSVGLVTAAFAQPGERQRNDSRNNDNSYQPSPYSNNDQYRNEDQYNSNSQWNERGSYNQFDRRRQRQARQRYEMMMMRRNQQRYHNQRRYDGYSPYGVSRRPAFQINIGIGGGRRY